MMNQTRENMINDDWKEQFLIAVKDLVRLGGSIYQASGRSLGIESHAEGELPSTAGGVKIASGDGPRINLGRSYWAFKNDYVWAQHELIKLIRPHIKGNTRRFEISFRRSADEPFGRHRWWVFEASEESEAWLATESRDVTAEDAARVLRV